MINNTDEIIFASYVSVKDPRSSILLTRTMTVERFFRFVLSPIEPLWDSAPCDEWRFLFYYVVIRRDVTPFGQYSKSRLGSDYGFHRSRLQSH